jgi:hypothetical protein
MTLTSLSAPPPAPAPPLPPALVLLACGTPAKVAARLHKAAPVLAEALGLALAPSLDPADPQGALAALSDLVAGAGGSPSRLAPLPRDPGQGLAGGGHWAEALGAWRQPALLLFSAKQLNSGLPAAATALLERWQVPCAGLVQWGGRWQAGGRRADALPWLGGLQLDGAAEAADPLLLRRALALRWQQLEGR